jgi:hypothetical protein
MADESEKLAPGEAENAAVREAMTYDGGRHFETRPTVAGAVRRMVGRRPPVKPNGIFKHPPTWDQEELDFIADCLKQNIPLYTIANMVRCERHTLSNLVNSRPELAQLKEDKYDNLLEEAEYQADRLMKAGNAAVVIHVLNTLGQKKGWGGDAAGSGEEDAGRIVMGLIPTEEVEKADAETKERQKGMMLEQIDPMQMALTEEAVKSEVDKRMNVVEAQGASESPLGGGESVVDMAEHRDLEGYMQTGGGMAQPDEAPDPWADGANSMFFQ